MNTGDSIVALHYSFTSAAFTATRSPSSPGECAYSSHLTQVFVSGSPLQQTATLSGPPCASLLSAHPKMFGIYMYLAGSPASHLLPIDVYIGDQLMADVSLHSDKVPYCH